MEEVETLPTSFGPKFKFDLKMATNLTGLSLVLGTPAKTLGYYVYKRVPDNQYRKFSIRKRAGGAREINAPATNLKLIQKSIAKELTKLREFGPSVNGYVQNKSIKTNAIFHLRKKYVLNIDLKDFFGTITGKRVYGMLISKPYELKPKIAAYISTACTLNGSLPQGAPSSPIISNLICGKLDSELVKLARALRCTYTRYADDITFSSNSENIFRLISIDAVNPEEGEKQEFVLKRNVSDLLKSIIVSNGFEINSSKVRFAHKGSRQEVTGLVVNEKVNVKRRFVRQIRAMLHAWRKYGYDLASKEFHTKYNRIGHKLEFSRVIRGKLSFVRSVKGAHDSAFRSLAAQFNDLNSKLPKAEQITPINIALTEKEMRERAVWVLEDHKTDNQGTAFFLKGVGLVTCSHCLSDNMYIYHPSFYGKKYDVKLLKHDKDVDLAVLTPSGSVDEATELSIGNFEAASSADKVTLYGYPNHSHAYPIRVEEGIFLRSFTQSAIRRCEVSPRIVQGNSGGPLLTADGGVIGVATKGINKSTKDFEAQFLCVSIDMLKHAK